MPARYAVFGQPIAHSLSPRIHTMFGTQFGIVLDYRAIAAGHADFEACLAQFESDDGRGANVTLPLKQDAHGVCSTLSARAQRCGSVNTLSRDDGGWHGDSTDGIGLLRDLTERLAFDPCGQRILLLGAGGAARAVAFALADAGAAELVIANRTQARAHALADAFDAPARVRVLGSEGARATGAFDLIVNATAAGHDRTAFELPLEAVAPRALCYDLSYGDAADAFLASARAAGAIRVSDGLGMLVEQAAEAFSIWHGVRPDTGAVHAALRAQLAGGAAD